MFHIIGLAHRAQSWDMARDKDERQQAFEMTLLRTIQDVRPHLIAEEDSEESLAQRRVSSIARAIADREHIEHRFCDPTPEQRREIGYRDGQSLELEMFMQDQDGLSKGEIFLRARAIEIGRYFPIREAFWLERLAPDLDREVVFICGDAHVESFGGLLEARGVPYRVVERGIGLTEEDAWFDRASLYLRQHPELTR